MGTARVSVIVNRLGCLLVGSRVDYPQSKDVI
jgi:hypothetical protein